jgi:threonine aldolase
LLARSNFDQEEGYGLDTLCLAAEARLKALLENTEAAVHFVSGGTQANLIVLPALLKSYESVIAPVTAHINVHEAGAIEATGHKIHLVASADGKLTADQVQAVVDAHTDEHMVKPRAVSITQPTELGTVYRKSELESMACISISTARGSAAL